MSNNYYKFHLMYNTENDGINKLSVCCDYDGSEFYIDIKYYDSEEKVSSKAPETLKSATVWKLETETGEKYEVSEIVSSDKPYQLSGEMPKDMLSIFNACHKWLGNQWITIPKIPWTCFKEL